MERVTPFTHKLVQRRNMKDCIDCEVASLERNHGQSMLDLHPAVRAHSFWN